MSSMACSKWVRELLTAVETGTSMSGGASKSSSSSSAGMMVAGGACRSSKAYIGPRVLLCGADTGTPQ